MSDLVLSLGHNSSAILISNNKILCGYEEERFSGIKADSHFPIKAMINIKKYFPEEFKGIQYIYISHWETYGDVTKMSEKHFNMSQLNEIFNNEIPKIISHNSPMFTHHDAHMVASKIYSEESTDNYIVADGFGNYNEVLSIYDHNHLIFRAHGYGKSLGLWYQYTTAFLGLKMNQDEYKLLGYEAHIKDIINKCQLNIDDLYSEVSKLSRKMIKVLFKSKLGFKLDALYDIESLIIFRTEINQYWKNVCNNLQISYTNNNVSDEIKTIIAFILQLSIESVFTYIIKKFKISSVTLSGGLFYNVKLNNHICSLVNKICIYPWSGDQGAALGVYGYFNYTKGLKIKNLNIGYRDLSAFTNKHYYNTENKLLVFDNMQKAINNIINFIDQDKIVNIVHGNMEFGPRALGYTSSIMKPSLSNVEYINMVNGRDTIMPCAPIVYDVSQFKDYEKVIRSLDHMIIALPYKIDPDIDTMGAAHKHPIHDFYTGRPQWIHKNHFLYPVIKKFKILINTSFNIHGVPIVNTPDQILFSHNYQQKIDVLDKVVTIIIK